MATEHFTDKELECRCGCGGLPSELFQNRLEALRKTYGRPMRVNSAARCPDHNEAVSTTGRNGPHTIDAIDISVYGGHAFLLTKLAMQLQWQGVGWKQHGPRAGRFVHLDFLVADNRPWIWSYA